MSVLTSLFHIHQPHLDGFIWYGHICEDIDDSDHKPLAMDGRIVLPSYVVISLSNVTCKCSR